MMDAADFKKYTTIEEASKNVLLLISRFIGINTLFVAKNDTQKNKIVDVINQNYTLLEKGSELPFEETLCRVAVKEGAQPLVIERLNENDLTKDLAVTHSLVDGSFIGIPIYYENGENYGTICAIDNKPFEFKEEHIEMFKTMATLLTSVLEVEKAYNDVYLLSVPIVPLGEGIGVVPIIGSVDEDRSELIMKIALEESQKRNLDYLVIDLSGMVKMDDRVSLHLVKIAHSLHLLGVKVVLTGFRPDLILKSAQHNVDFKYVVIKATLEQAIKFIRNSRKN